MLTPVLSKASEPTPGGDEQNLRSVFCALRRSHLECIRLAGPWRGVGHTPHPGLERCSPAFLHGDTEISVCMAQEGEGRQYPRPKSLAGGQPRGPKGNILHACARSLLKLGNSTLRCTWPHGAKVTDAGWHFEALDFHQHFPQCPSNWRPKSSSKAMPTCLEILFLTPATHF